MVLNSLFPVFALIGLGVLLKKARITNDAFLETSDRLIYYFFFPLMLFWKIAGADTDTGMPWPFILSVLGALAVIYAISAAAIRLFRIQPFQAGTFSQSCYRFNTYIGMAIVLNAQGPDGVRLFSILVGIAIPIINVMAVSTLIWYSGTEYPLPQRLKMTLKALIGNPLILACIAGMAYAHFLPGFPRFIDNTLALAAMVALPMALLSIGGALGFHTVRGNWRESIIGAVIKLAIYPVLGFFALRMAGIGGTALSTGMLFFALPTSPAIYVLSSQLNSDTQLASATIVASTLLSFISLSVVLMVFF